MLSFFANMLRGRRRTGVLGLLDRRRTGGFVNGVNSHRGAALGELVSLAAPFMIRKIMNRRAQNAR